MEVATMNNHKCLYCVHLETCEVAHYVWECDMYLNELCENVPPVTLNKKATGMSGRKLSGEKREVIHVA
jgi:hypothetical protein